MIVLFGIVWHVDGREIAEAQLILIVWKNPFIVQNRRVNITSRLCEIDPVRQQ
jgi:hypothetical protein